MKKRPIYSTKIVILQPDQWVDRYAVHFYNYALLKVNDAELSRDLVQETFLTALENCDTFEQRSSERSWLTGILKIKIYNIYNQRLKNIIFVTDFKEVESNIFFKDGAIIADLHDPFATKEFFDFINRCVHQWPPLWQTVFLLKYIELKEAEFICNKLKLTSSYYWVICHRIKLSLKRSLDDFWL